MKQYLLLFSMFSAVLLSWCDFMVPKDTEWSVFSWVWDTFNEMVWTFSWNKIGVNTGYLSEILHNNEWTWTMTLIKWYAQQYYDDTIAWYIDEAKEWLSWIVQDAKAYYNSWVDSLTNSINNAISGSIADKMNELKM